MTSKEELRQIRHLDHEINFMLEQLEEIKTSLTRISPVLSDMPKGNSSGNHDKIGDGIAKILELQEMINTRVDYLYQYKKSIIQVTNEIEKSVYRRILELRYLNEKYNSFEDISVAIGYSYFRTVRMHGEALDEYRKVRDQVIVSSNNRRSN